MNLTVSCVEVVDLIFNVMKNHQTNTVIQIGSCEILNHVLYHHESTMKNIVGKDGMKLLTILVQMSKQ
jgi:hypothetical protein